MICSSMMVLVESARISCDRDGGGGAGSSLVVVSPREVAVASLPTSRVAPPLVDDSLHPAGPELPRCGGFGSLRGSLGNLPRILGSC